MPYRIEVLAHNEDGRALQIQKALKAMGKKAAVRVVDVYTSANPTASNPKFVNSLANPVVQKVGIAPPTALDVPVVSLFGPTHIAWTRTSHPRALHLQQPVPCGPCQKGVCPLGHHRCMRELDPRAVFDAAMRLLGP